MNTKAKRESFEQLLFFSPLFFVSVFASFSGFFLSSFLGWSSFLLLAGIFSRLARKAAIAARRLGRRRSSLKAATSAGELKKVDSLSRFFLVLVVFTFTFYSFCLSACLLHSFSLSFDRSRFNCQFSSAAAASAASSVAAAAAAIEARSMAQAIERALFPGKTHSSTFFLVV